MVCCILRGEAEVYNQSYLKVKTFLMVTIDSIYYLTSVYHNQSQLLDCSYLVQTEKQFIDIICLVFHRSSYPSLIKTPPGCTSTFHTRFPADPNFFL